MCKTDSTTQAGQAVNPKEWTEPHPLLNDGWKWHDDPEQSTVQAYTIADITRAAMAIRSMSRIVSNSLGEPSATGAQPLNQGTHEDLLGGIEMLGSYIFHLTNEMRDHARLFISATSGEDRA